MRFCLFLSVFLLVTACSEAVPTGQESPADEASFANAQTQTDNQIDMKGGLFAGLLGKKGPEDTPLTSEKDPEVNDEKVEEQKEDTDATTNDPPLSTEKKAGLFAGLFKKQDDDPASDTPGESDKDTSLNGDKETPEPVSGKTVARDVAPVEEDASTAAQDSANTGKKRGLFGLLSPAASTGTDGEKKTSSQKNKDTIAAQDIAFGASLPYGQVGRVCHFPRSKLGKKIDQYPEKKAKYKLYDSKPGNTGLHSFYITGFADGCARQFTASVAIFGSAGMHEQLRYGLPASVQPYSDTDKTYEKLKTKICHVPRKKPCGDKVAALEKDTVFLSIYERFGGNSRWSNLLLHSGRIVAQDRKGG